MFGGKKRRERRLAEVQASRDRTDRLLAALCNGAIAVVDGDAVSMLGWPHLATSDQRGALVDHLHSMIKPLPISSDLIRIFFDRTVDDAVPRSKKLIIELVEDRNAAAEQALECVDGVEDCVAIWGKDANAMSLRAAGARLVEPEDLLDSFLDPGD